MSTTDQTSAQARIAALNAKRAGATTGVASGPADNARVPKPSRRHAAKGSRGMALTASLVATGALSLYFSHTGNTTSIAAPTVSPVAQANAAPSAANGTSLSLAAQTYTGTVSQTKYGPVQVQIQVANGKITNATATESPGGASKSVSINARALPVLRTETLAVQSASVNTVSGATYTSDGYKTSLQSAIDQSRTASASAA